MQCDKVPEMPVFDATIEVRVFKFKDVLNRHSLANALREGNTDNSVTHNLTKTMTKTIFDTMTNANLMFYKDMKTVKDRKGLEKTNEAKDILLKDLSESDEMFDAFQIIVEGM
jgi:hypothetical protein